MPPRLLLALAVSIALHAEPARAASASRRHRGAATRGATLVQLRPPPEPLTPPAEQAVPAEPLLSNTLVEHDAPPAAKPPACSSPPSRPFPLKANREATRREVSRAQKLSQHPFYPPEALARGLEGEVRCSSA